MDFIELQHGAREAPLLVSPYHPIATPGYDDGRWQFPLQMRGAVARFVKSECMVSYVLTPEDPTHTLEPPHAVINGFKVIAFAHNLSSKKTDAVAGHAFFGTAKSLAALQRDVAGWAAGEVTVQHFIREERCGDGEPQIVDLALLI